MSMKNIRPSGNTAIGFKWFAVFLALVLFTSGTPLPASAEVVGATVSLDKALYLPNESITVTALGITQEMKDADAWVGIYKVGAQHNQWGSYRYLEAGNSQVEIDAPEELGSYEMRFYSKNKVYTDETLVMRVPFTVAMQKQGKISLEKSAYQARQFIEVAVTGITKEMEQAEAYVSIYRKGAAHSSWGTYAFVKSGDSVVNLEAPNLNGEFEMRLYSINRNYTDESFVMSVPFTLSGAVEEKTSPWATATIKKAEELGLIPNILKGADLTKPITRKEFAAVSVKLYEKLSGKDATPAAINTFTDTSDTDILKAYALDIVAGVGNNKFAPNELLTREQAATMLTRVYKKVNWEGWTLAGDNSYTKHSLDNKGVTPFSDDAKISAYAKPSVYFMAKYKIIQGSNNIFAPRNTTSAEAASGYANATREQALAISNRTFENADVIKDGGPTTAPSKPAEPPVTTPSPTTPALTTPTAPASTPTPTPTTPPPSGSNSNTSEDWLNRTWVYSTGTSSAGFAIILEFKADGTFDKALGTVTGYYYYSSTAFEGKYKVSNNKIHLYEQKKSTAYASSSSALWRMSDSIVKDIPVEDEEFAYSKSEEGNLIFNDAEYHPMEE